MEDSHDLFLTLFAVQLYGGENVPKNLPVFKGLTPAVKEALSQQLLAEAKQKVATGETLKSGKPKMKSVAVYNLTDEGSERLQSFSDPSVVAASQYGAALAMRNQLNEAQQALQDEVKTSLAASDSQAKSPLETRLEAVGKSLQQLAGRLEKVEDALKSDPRAVEHKIDAAFVAMHEKLNRVIGEFENQVGDTVNSVKRPAGTQQPEATQQPETEEKNHAPQQREAKQADKESPISAASADDNKAQNLRNTVADAYKDLCRRVEFEDGLVDIPHLYYKTQQDVPDLSVEQLQNELTRMWDEQILELHIANEIDKVSHTEMGIWRDESFYYYIYWPDLL